jgi:hypothetical protein
MVSVKIKHGNNQLLDAECPGLRQGESIQSALGGIQLTFVYYVEVDTSTVVAAVAPIQPNDVQSLEPTLAMHPEFPHEPLFVLYLALQDDEPIDLTDELFAHAQKQRTDMIYENKDSWENYDHTDVSLSESSGMDEFIDRMIAMIYGISSLNNNDKEYGDGESG